MNDIEIGLEQPEDYTYKDAAIGKWTYFGKGVQQAIENGYVQRIGRFTSINSTVMIHVNHHFNMIFVNDEIEKLFSDEHKAMYQARLRADPKLPYMLDKSNLLTIGSDVWIGANAFINCSRVKSIGDGAVIGAGAVVLEDVPPYAVVAGVPAQVKRFRFTPEQIETLLRVRFWDWDDAAIRENAALLINPDQFFARFSG